jgi:ketosteroid isomerase-like protein
MVAGCRSMRTDRERRPYVRKDIATEILDSEREVADAWRKHDVAAASRLFADDYRSISTLGPGLTKSDILDEVAQPYDTNTDVLEESVRVVSPDVAIYTARILDYGISAGAVQPFKVTTRVLDIWVLRHGTWQVIADQTIYVKPDGNDSRPPPGVPVSRQET